MSYLMLWVSASGIGLFFFWFITWVYIEYPPDETFRLSYTETKILEAKVKRERSNYILALTCAGGFATVFFIPLYFDFSVYDETGFVFLGSLVGFFSLGKLVQQFLSKQWKYIVRGSCTLLIAGVAHQLAQNPRLIATWVDFFRLVTFAFLVYSLGTLIYGLLLRDRTIASEQTSSVKPAGKLLALFLITVNLIQLLDALLNHIERFTSISP
jgi:hypothetical protein